MNSDDLGYAVEMAMCGTSGYIDFLHCFRALVPYFEGVSAYLLGARVFNYLLGRGCGIRGLISFWRNARGMGADRDIIRNSDFCLQTFRLIREAFAAHKLKPCEFARHLELILPTVIYEHSPPENVKALLDELYAWTQDGEGMEEILALFINLVGSTRLYDTDFMYRYLGPRTFDLIARNRITSGEYANKFLGFVLKVDHITERFIAEDRLGRLSVLEMCLDVLERDNKGYANADEIFHYKTVLRDACDEPKKKSKH
jgi:hypothetical protein